MGNITNIDENGLVTIKFSQLLDNSIFNITRNNETLNLPRYLQENSSNVITVGDNQFNISDINRTMLKLYIAPSFLRLDGFDKKRFEFNWEIVYFRYEFVYI